MKTRFAILVLLFASFQALSQAVENDDMYFTSKDRVKQNLERVNKSNRIVDKKSDDQNLTSTAINPTDSYSARNINPEYLSRSRSDAESTEDQDGYFSNSYQPTGVNRNLYNNYSGNSFYSPYYGNGYNNGFNNYGYGGMGGMYGGGMYNPYGGFGGGYGMSPGLSMGLGYGMGMGMGMGSFYGGMGYGFGMPSSFMMNRYFYDPYYGYYNPWNSFGYGGMGMGYGGMYNSWYSPYYGSYPGYVNVAGGDNGGRNLSYQRRQDRSSTLNNTVTNDTRAASATRNGRTITSSGRTNSDAAQSQNYYQRGWRNNGTSTPTSRSQWNNASQWNNSSNGTSNSGRSSWNNGNSSGGNNSWSGGNTGGSNSRSSWSNGGTHSGSFSGGSGSFSGGGRSTGSSGGGGGGGGSSRGRH
ncbi:MAG TPA: hypothetical protein VK508_16765 [Cyclobacteriaceae bacterium]|nr:hypothetical protein [Cyclobacteriaceae bacterium]